MANNVTNLSAFFATEMEQISNEFVVVTERAKDAEGNPIPWEIRALPNKEIKTIRKECTTVKRNKKGVPQEEFDATKFEMKLCAACVVFPNLLDAELQDSWGVRTPEELLGKMLLSGEQDVLSQAVMAINGYAMDFEEEVETAKN